jgi:hypothetical protein
MGRVEEKITGNHLTSEELEHRALTLQSIGWLLLIVDAIVAVFIFSGIRTGSWLWVYWTLIEGVCGLGFIVAGLRQEELAVEALAHSVEPHLHAAETDHRKAA